MMKTKEERGREEEEKGKVGQAKQKGSKKMGKQRVRSKSEGKE